MFHMASIHDFIEYRKLQLKEEVDAARDNVFLSAEADLEDRLIEKHSISRPCIDIGGIHCIDSRSILVPLSNHSMANVPGQHISLAIPFSGDSELLKIFPSTFTLRRLNACLEGNTIVLKYEFPDSESQGIAQQIEGDKLFLVNTISKLEQDVVVFNKTLPEMVRKLVEQRRSRVQQQSKLLHSLNIPLKKREDLPDTYSIPVIRRKVAEIHSPPPAMQSEPEPTISLQDYNYILKICESMALAIERNPTVFRDANEESIRTFFLVFLNAHFEGNATGETFNGSGKTDILIRYNNSNIFIAECKFWKGAKVFVETIDQLLGYVTWRDTHTAIFIFNRNRDTSSVLAQIPELSKQHPHFKRVCPGSPGEVSFRYIFQSPKDSDKEIYLTICVFDMPTN